MKFPDFGLLHFFEENHDAHDSLSFSDMLPFHLKGFERDLGDLDLAKWSGAGSLELRRVIAQIHNVDIDRVLVTTGASEANFLVHAALLDAGDEVIAEVPTYPPLRLLGEGLGATVRPAVRDPETWRLAVDTVAALVTPKTRLLSFTNLNNPTCAPTEPGVLKALGDLAADRGFLVHVDETYRDLGFDEAPPTTATYGDQFVVTSTVTKVYGIGGIRIGWAIAAPDVLARLKNVKDFTSVTPSWPGEVIAHWALEQRPFFLNRAHKILEENRAIVQAWLKQQPRAHWELPLRGNLCFPRIDGDVEALSRRMLEEHGTILAPGRLFGYPDRFRLGFGRDGSRLRRGLENLDAVLASL